MKVCKHTHIEKTRDNIGPYVFHSPVGHAFKGGKRGIHGHGQETATCEHQQHDHDLYQEWHAAHGGMNALGEEAGDDYGSDGQQGTRR